MKATDVLHFDSGAQFRAWLARHHGTAPAQWVAIAKKNATKWRLGYADALDAALAYGWIDGFVSKLDDTHYGLRFTPRKPKSNWSAVNVKRYQELLALGRIEAAGQRAFENRDRAVSEEVRAELDGALLKTFQRNARAWAFFAQQPPGYRRQASWSVLSARTEPTRQRRLQALIEASARGERVGGGASKASASKAAVKAATTSAPARKSATKAAKKATARKALTRASAK
jgi:uncharacterized protein YdeI (YjbR/CyaY-like superfamily)